LAALATWERPTAVYVVTAVGEGVSAEFPRHLHTWACVKFSSALESMNPQWLDLSEA
jgi:hypothetical protein